MNSLFNYTINSIGKILKPIIRNPPHQLVKLPIIKPIPVIQPTPTPILIPEIRLEFTPKKDFIKPILWKYYPNKSKDIWYAQNYQDYIQPYDELVAYFTDRIELNAKIFKDQAVLFYKQYSMDEMLSSKAVVNFKYRVDDSRLCTESGQKDIECNKLQDFWMNPGYYIWNELEGDCDDYSIFMASVLERLNIPYMIVGGYISFLYGIKDWWIEFIYEEKVYIGQINLNVGTPNLLDNVKSGFVPLLMFNKKTLITEYEKWY